MERKLTHEQKIRMHLAEVIKNDRNADGTLIYAIIYGYVTKKDHKKIIYKSGYPIISTQEKFDRKEHETGKNYLVVYNHNYK